MERDTMIQETIMQQKLAYSVEEISEMTSLSKAFLRLEIKANKLKAKLCGRRVLILNSDLQSYLQGQGDWKPQNERGE
jgi:excisionase family DNA binding protein